MARILVIDDHPVVRQGIKHIISVEPHMRTVGEAKSAEQGLALALTEKWDAVVLDISMPGRNGLEILKVIHRERLKLPVLVLTMHREDQYALRALNAGAAGYLSKESAAEELIHALKKVLRGEKYMSPSLTDKLVGDLAAEKGQQPHEDLSDREYQVLCLIASGKSVSDIGRELCLSVKTISTYRTRVLEKMRLTSNAELTRYAMVNQLVE